MTHTSDLQKIQHDIAESIALKQQLLNDPHVADLLQQAADLWIRTYRQGGKVLFCGNGGSAADAQHLAAELSGRFRFNRPPLDAEALHGNTSYLTAVANDFGYEQIYARLVQACGHAGDVLVGISTSGNSENIVKAFRAARERGIHTVALTGAGGGALSALSTLLIAVPSTDTPRIQECHILIGHIVCDLVEGHLFGEEASRNG